MQRIHSHSRNLSKADKTDESPKKDKRRSREIHVLPKISEGQESHGHYDDENERPRSVTETSFEKRKHHRHHSRHHHEHKDQKGKKDIKDIKDLMDDDENERPRSFTDISFEKKKRHHRHHSHHHEHKDHKDKKDTKDLGEKKPHHHRRHHHRQLMPPPHQHRTISEREQLQSRLRSGILTLREIEPIQERLATEKDEASHLAKRDLEEMACKLIAIFNFFLQYFSYVLTAIDLQVTVGYKAI